MSAPKSGVKGPRKCLSFSTNYWTWKWRTDPDPGEMSRTTNSTLWFLLNGEENEKQSRGLVERSLRRQYELDQMSAPTRTWGSSPNWSYHMCIHRPKRRPISLYDGASFSFQWTTINHVSSTCTFSLCEYECKLSNTALHFDKVAPFSLAGKLLRERK